LRRMVVEAHMSKAKLAIVPPPRSAEVTAGPEIQVFLR